MKILIISQYAGAPEMGMVLRNHNWASEFIRLGHQCTIIAASYSHYRQKNKNIVGKKLEEENIDKITYYWLKTLSYDGKNNILRLFSIFQFQLRLSLFLKKLQ
ncbi:MAG: glycosyltransferase WbuB, partial [Pseudomonadota bacterium]|nr:glycosyltransferase WbuB [Pseudomonadota bacterium]